VNRFFSFWISACLVVGLFSLSTVASAADDEIRIHLRTVHHRDCPCNEVPLGVGIHRLFGDRFVVDAGAGVFVNSLEYHVGYAELGGGVNVARFFSLPDKIDFRLGVSKMVYWGGRGDASKSDTWDVVSIAGAYDGVGLRFFYLEKVKGVQLTWAFD
jgi:hypothetical protein